MDLLDLNFQKSTAPEVNDYYTEKTNVSATVICSLYVWDHSDKPHDPENCKRNTNSCQIQ